MKVKFVKYCPLCGAENPERASMCQVCFKGDLTRARRERPRGEAEPETVDLQGDADSAAAGAEPAQIAGRVAPVTGTAAVPQLCTLELVQDPAVKFSVHPGQTVGRTDKADVVLEGVPHAEYIHGAHARLFTRGPQWYAQYLGGFNFIRVDNVEYRGNEEVALHDGSVLVLSLTPFYVRLGGQ